MAGKITVHDPRGFPPKVTGKRLANRESERLDGKVVYLIDCLFENSDNFDGAAAAVVRRAPAVREHARIIKPRE